MVSQTTKFTPLKKENYYPRVVERLLERVLTSTAKTVVLYGFSDNMKWLLRLLQEHSIIPLLTDWRKINNVVAFKK